MWYGKWQSLCVGLNVLTLDVRGPSYLGLTRSISWLLMPWLLSSQGHQQPWYWLCKIGVSLSYLRKDFNYLCHVSVEEWHKMKYMFLFPLKNLPCKGLNVLCNMSSMLFRPHYGSSYTVPPGNQSTVLALPYNYFSPLSTSHGGWHSTSMVFWIIEHTDEQWTLVLNQTYHNSINLFHNQGHQSSETHSHIIYHPIYNEIKSL